MLNLDAEIGTTDTLEEATGDTYLCGQSVELSVDLR